jgi:dephospho-CoA kinase
VADKLISEEKSPKLTNHSKPLEKTNREVTSLVLIAGLPGAGKTTVAKILAEKGLPVLSMGDIIREEARRRGKQDDIDSMRGFMVQLRKERGEAIVAELVIKKLGEISGPLVVIDGLRSEKELEAFRRVAGKVLLILVVSDLQHRFQRLSKRARPDDPKEVDDLRRRDDTELTVGLEKLMSREGIRIVNDGDVKSLKRKTVELFRKQGSVYDVFG